MCRLKCAGGRRNALGRVLCRLGHCKLGRFVSASKVAPLLFPRALGPCKTTGCQQLSTVRSSESRGVFVDRFVDLITWSMQGNMTILSGLSLSYVQRSVYCPL